jgi:hypothetical protein
MATPKHKDGGYNGGQTRLCVSMLQKTLRDDLRTEPIERPPMSPSKVFQKQTKKLLMEETDDHCRFLIQWNPPGIMLEYTNPDKTTEMKAIVLPPMDKTTDFQALVETVMGADARINPEREPQIRRLLKYIMRNDAYGDKNAAR